MDHSLEQKLPEDIILDVLLRLSSKELCRLRCVSKLWYHYISRCRAQRWKPSPYRIGFFYQHIQTNNPKHNGFLYTSKEKSDGRRLKSNGMRLLDGNLDEHVGFVDAKNVYIVTSSNGILLCCQQMQYPLVFYRWRQCTMEYLRHMQYPMEDYPMDYYFYNRAAMEYYPMDYYIYNPAAKQWLALPKPQHCYEQVAIGFSCRVDDPANDLISYKIVRYGIPDTFTELKSIITLECFSSESGAWTTVEIKLDVPHPLYMVDCPAVELDGVFFWLDRGPQIIAVDVVGSCSWELELPHVVEKFYVFDELFASNGCLCHVTDDAGLTQIWCLKSNFRCPNAKWQLQYQGYFRDIISKFPEIFGPVDSVEYMKILAFHPDYPEIIYLDVNKKVVSLDINNKIVEILDTFRLPSSFTKEYRFIPYEWNEWPRILPPLKSV